MKEVHVSRLNRRQIYEYAISINVFYLLLVILTLDEIYITDSSLFMGVINFVSLLSVEFRLNIASSKQKTLKLDPTAALSIVRH